LTNEERIRQLPTAELAELLLTIKSYPDYDENRDGEMYHCGDIDYYVAGDGEEWMDREDALEHQMWWLKQAVEDEPKEDLISAIDMTNIETSIHGVNAKIKAHTLPDKEMKAAGFTFRDNLNAWCLFGLLDDKYDIEFYVRVYPDDLDHPYINIVDGNFGQPYDYQYILNRSNNPIALQIKELVEEEMERLQGLGVLSGHVRGEYI
jgi:hypothetical protein